MCFHLYKYLSYYPHDVSRAADLLKGGAVLDTSLQPYESHIPFLLQFLVDYNLYGMSHMHLLKIKFRHPVPDGLSPKKTKNLSNRQMADNGPDLQVDSSRDACLSFPVWISSKIPGGWLWPFSNEFDSSDKSSWLFKRQSICELEGDSTVDDILNQQHKMYSSLSQTRSDIKMVQSLVPIWEEEYERTGMHDVGMPSDPGKPCPAKVLKTLSNGDEFRRAFMELCEEAESFQSFTQSSHDARPSEERDLCPKQLTIDDIRTPQMIETLYPKAADKEALELLKWLASSQAAEDVNSDDELVRQTILSPLLPSTTIDLVLEKANVDYENESQQECQDILDSVDDFIDYESFKARGFTSDDNIHCPSQTSSEKTIIPQVDGSCDDGQELSHCENPKRKRSKALWGPLPLSVNPKENMNNLQGTSCGEANAETDTSLLIRNELGGSSVSPMASGELDGSDSTEASLAKCSVRELMRKKRSYRADSLEDCTHGGRKLLYEEEREEDKFVCPKELDFHVLQTEKPEARVQEKDGVDSHFLSTLAVDTRAVDVVGMTFCKKPPAIEGHSDSKSDNHVATSVQGRDSNEFLPFFQLQEEKESKSKFGLPDDANFHQEAALGVPTHYKNDGTFLYMLTPTASPPSKASVCRWMSRYDTDALRENFCSSLKESPQNLQNREVNPFHDVVSKESASSEGNPNVKEGSDNFQDFSQISGPDEKSKLTPLSQIGFRDPASVGGGQQLTLLSIEVSAESRADLRPDPRFDAINVIALTFQEDNESTCEAYILLRCDKGSSHERHLKEMFGCEVIISSEEKQLFNHFVKVMEIFDPDVLMGWDIQGGSLGFLAERASHLGIGLLNKLSRTPSEFKLSDGDTRLFEKSLPENVLSETLQEDAIIGDEWGRTHASGIHVGGRIVLNLWRLMRSEVKLNMYTVEAVSEAVLRRKVPSIYSRVLTNWFRSGSGRARFRCIEFVTNRAKLNLEIMNQLDIINRTSELARIFGIDFFSVLSRGSQYRVESMFLRLAHMQNYLAISPGYQQVASQPAMECIPLVMEPESSFYSDPVVVLDFQSLYPSMIIAYNLCFSTCLGKIVPSKPNTLGVSVYSPEQHVIQDSKDEILLTPNGVMYVPAKVRKGVLPRLLEEILSTRIMVKQAMKKLGPPQQVLHRIFNARQLALKLIANVTYGYTAAGFSGRMPCAELADSIVQCGRRTLESAISLVNSHEKWKAKVIYGDTDSMFVLLKGRTVKESFEIGHEIASSVTAMNPHPVTLKMEKVYYPSFLLTKKRYVGYSYESPEQIGPAFDAKGIETVRRDTCGVVAKTMEKSLRLFFEHQDIFKVKVYLQHQWTRIIAGKASIQDFVFAKEVRLGTYSTKASSLLPPAAIVVTKAMKADPRAEPRYAERIPYIVIHGEPGARLADMVVDPLDVLAIDSPLRLNDLYYINKQIIPALQRVFGLVGADLNRWFSEMPRPVRSSFSKLQSYAPNLQRTRIDYYYLSKHCILCGGLVQASAYLCDKCSKDRAAAVAAVIGRTSKLERDIQHLVAICRHCGSGDWIVESGVKCTSLACPVFYERRKVQKDLQAISSVATEAGFYPRCMVEWF